MSFVRERVQVAHQAFEALLENMGIDLCRRNVGMAQQRLHHPKIGAVVQKVAGECVAKHVRAHLRGAQPGGAGKRLEIAGEVLTAQMTGLAEGGEKPFRLMVRIG